MMPRPIDARRHTACAEHEVIQRPRLQTSHALKGHEGPVNRKEEPPTCVTFERHAVLPAYASIHERRNLLKLLRLAAEILHLIGGNGSIGIAGDLYFAEHGGGLEDIAL